MKISYLVTIITGFFLSVLGLVLLGLESYKIYAGLMLVLGIFLMIFFGRYIIKDCKDALKQRSSKSFIHKIVISVMAFGILIMLNYLSYENHYQFDATHNKRFSLSDQTKKTLKRFDGKIRFVLFEKQGSLAQEDAKTLFRQYTYNKPSIKLRFLDLDQNPDVAAKYSVKLGGTLVVVSGERSMKVESLTETAITNALLKLMQKEKKKVYFVDGHGENALIDTGRGGFNGARKALESQNYMVKGLNFLTQSSVPEDCSVLVVAGPKKEYLPEEVERIDTYLKKGGRCLFLLDPPPSGAFKKYLKESWGVVPGDDVIVDRMGKLMGGNELTPVVMAYGEHEITRNFRYYTFFPLARSINVDKNVRGVEHFSLAKTSPASWAEKDFKKEVLEYNDGVDDKGPVNLIVAAKKLVPQADAKTKGKDVYAEIVVIGDSDFAANGNISVSQMGNRDFFLNIVSWLADEGELISIRPKERGQGELTLTDEMASLVWIFVIVLLPLGWAVKGLVEWIKRRRL